MSKRKSDKPDSNSNKRQRLSAGRAEEQNREIREPPSLRPDPQSHSLRSNSKVHYYFILFFERGVNIFKLGPRHGFLREKEGHRSFHSRAPGRTLDE
jgi:hypothetical protein